MAAAHGFEVGDRVTVSTPKVSVIIATYCSGEGLQRVIDSLDAQTLPQDEFETIFVDDGSPDDTYAALQKLASTRANMKVLRIENSGWPSRPRNVGMQHATGDYLFFMDHDDSLYPDGLRRAHEFAVETDADIVSTKESKTNDSWWGMSSLTQGNTSHVKRHGGIWLLLPLVPHKLYRRSLIEERHILFPDGRAVLWEDQFFNVAAYSAAKEVAVLADSPTYLWHASDTNTSHTFSPSTENFWLMLEKLLQFTVETLSSDELRDDRDTLLAHHMKTRVIDRTVRQLISGPEESGQLALTHARRLQSRYLTDVVFDRLPKKHQSQALLLRMGASGALRKMHRLDLKGRGVTRVLRARWEGHAMQLEMETTWSSKKPEEPILERTDDGRVLRAVGSELRSLLPSHLYDLTADPPRLMTSVILRARTSFVSWEVALESKSASFVDVESNPAARTFLEACVDVRTAELGRELAEDVWDLRYTADWVGMTRIGPVGIRTKPLPALIDQRVYIAYCNAKGGLTIDMTQHLRCLVTDAEPRLGPIGEADAIRMELQNLHIVGESRLDDTRVALARLDEDLGEQGVVLTLDDTRVAPIEGLVQAGADGAQVLGAVRQHLEAGGYALLANRENAWRSTRYCVEVSPDGSLELRLAQSAPAEAEPTATTVG